MTKLQITPETRVGDFLDNYPEHEELLIGLSPDFQKLRNPILRRTIGQFATFRHVAVMGNIPLEALMCTLRRAAGQNPPEAILEATNKLGERPSWFNAASVSETLDAREILRAGEHPLAEVITKTSSMHPGQIFELITPFTPVPLIEKISATGFSAYVHSIADSEIHTYFCRE